MDRASCAADFLDWRYAVLCYGGLYGVATALVHLDGVQSKVLVCDVLGCGVAFWSYGGVGWAGVVGWRVVINKYGQA